MQVTETLSEGLKREFKVVLPMQDLDKRLETELDTMKDKVRINGFRPGKVPVEHLRKVYGRSVMADVLQNAVNEANRKIVEDNGLKLANEPHDRVPRERGRGREGDGGAKGDLAFTVAPRGAAEVRDRRPSTTSSSSGRSSPRSEAEVDEALERMAAQNRPFAPKEGAGGDGRPRHRSTSSAASTASSSRAARARTSTSMLGSGQFIPGFEDQLVGAQGGRRAASSRSRFPENYQAAHLAGKAAEFDVTVKAVAGAGRTHDRRRARQGLRHGEPRQAQGRRARRDRSASIDGMSRAQAQARAARRARRASTLRAAADAGRAGVRRDLAAGRGGACSSRARPSPTRTRPRTRPAPNTAASPSAACASACVLAEIGEQAEGADHRRRAVRRPSSSGSASIPGQEKAGVGLLPEEPAGPGRDPRAPLRGEGRRPDRRQGEGDGQDRHARKTSSRTTRTKADKA